MATAPDPNTNPLAWAKWAMTRDPATFDQGRAEFSSNPGAVKDNRAALERAGLWKPEWNDWGNWRDDAGTGEGDTNLNVGNSWDGQIPDLSSLDGYVMQAYRGPGRSRFAEILDPKGKTVDVDQWEHDGSMRGSDWLQAATVVGGPMLAAAGGAAAIGNSLYGLQGAAGAAAGGATVGAATGGLGAAANGENILKGALKGAAIGGAGGYLSSVGGDYINGAVGGDLPSGMDLAADGGLNSIDSAASQFTSGGIPAANARTAVGSMDGFDSPAGPPQNGALPQAAGPTPRLSMDDPNWQPDAADTAPISGTPDDRYAQTVDRTVQRNLIPDATPRTAVSNMEGMLPMAPAAAAAGALATAASSQPDTSFRPSQNYGDGLTGNQTSAYDATINATGSGALAKTAADVVGAGTDLFGSAKDFLTPTLKAAGSLFDNSLLKTILPLIGAGVNQMNIEKIAQDQRNWQDKRDSDKRRRQMPGALKRARVTVIKGTPGAANGTRTG